MATWLRVVWVVSAAALCGSCAQTPRFHGPMPTRNQHPAQLTVLHLPPASASVLPAGQVAARQNNAYTSLFLSGSSRANTFAMDGELLRSGVQAAVGLGQGLELGTELAVAHTTGGFLDGFVIGWHDTFMLPDQSRDDAARGLYRIEATSAGSSVFHTRKETLRPVDLPVWLTWNLLPPDDGFGLAVRGGVEFPLGDEKRGFGNGEMDYSLGVVGEWQLPCVSLTGHAQHTFAGTPDRAKATGLEFGDVTSIGLEVELPLVTDLSAIAQVEWESSTLRDLDLKEASQDQVLLWTGGRLRLWRDLHLEMAVGEDLVGYVSPDITAWISFAWLPSLR